MPAFTPVETALNELLHQRLKAAGCQHGRFEISEPGTCLSLSGQRPDGRTLFFWEFGRVFHQVVSDYLLESYTEHTAQLAIQVEVAEARFHYSRLTKPQAAPPTLAQ